MSKSLKIREPAPSKKYRIRIGLVFLVVTSLYGIAVISAWGWL